MEIIKFDETWFDQLLALEQACFGITAWGKEEWTEILADRDHVTVYLMEENGQAVAFLAIYNWGTEKNYVKISDIGTKPGFQGKKIAHQLMETMIAEMEARGMYAFAGETRVTNYPMQKVFEDFGFQNVYTMENYYDDPTEDALRYHLIHRKTGPIGW